MFLSRIKIKNFRNFESIDVPLAGNVVLIGENQVGKSNLLYAIRLVIDAALPDSARSLKLSDFWDGCDITKNPEILVDLDFSGFDDDPALIALLTDFRIPTDPKIARLSYLFRKRGDVTNIQSDKDCEFLVYGGGDENRAIPYIVRRRIALDMLEALRDAENQLVSWRNSPIKPLLEDAIKSVSQSDLYKVAQTLETATTQIESLTPVKDLETNLRKRILKLSGEAQDIDARLRFAPADPTKLFRAISMYIDDGKRTISEASLGSANVALIALKLAEFDWERSKNQRNYSLVCIEEPEAHLHPQLQRAMFSELFNNQSSNQGLIVSSHSPTLAAAAPLRQIVNLRAKNNATAAYSLADLPVTEDELDDIERYLNATRSELMFAKGVILVEGDAEEALLPSFAESISINLDRKGISVCNVAGTNFTPYVKLVEGLGLPFSVITDWDPLDGTKPPLGKARTLGIWDAICQVNGASPLKEEEREYWMSASYEEFKKWSSAGVFLNEQTFEVAVAKTPGLQKALLDILNEQGFGSIRTKRIADWNAGQPVNSEQLLAMVADVGKGRLSAKLAKKVKGLTPPDYISNAIKHVSDYV